MAVADSASNSGVAKWLVAGLVLLAIVAGLVWLGTRSQISAARTGDMAVLAANADKPGVVTTASGLQYEVIRAGTGARPAATDTVLVHYEGRLVDTARTVFDSSYARGQPAAFPVDAVIPGWTEALQLMPAGSKYRIMLPPELGYGGTGAGDAIPPGAVLEFDVELLAIKPR